MPPAAEPGDAEVPGISLREVSSKALRRHLWLM